MYYPRYSAPDYFHAALLTMYAVECAYPDKDDPAHWYRQYLSPHSLRYNNKYRHRPPPFKHGTFVPTNINNRIIAIACINIITR